MLTFTSLEKFYESWIAFLEAISSGVISSEEMNWVVSTQRYFSRIDEATALRFGRLLDRGFIQISCRTGIK